MPVGLLESFYILNGTIPSYPVKKDKALPGGNGDQMEDLYARGKDREQERRGLSVEQKLELSHMLRQEQDYNRLQMDKREMLVYGRAAARAKKKKYNDMLKSGYGRTTMLRAAESEDAEAEAAWQKMQRRNRASFVTRGFLSVLLFVIVLLMRFAGLKFGDVDYQNLLESLGDKEFVDGIDFEEIIPAGEGEQSMPETENEGQPQQGELQKLDR